MTTTNNSAPPLGKTPATTTSGPSTAETSEMPTALAAMMTEDEAVAAQAEAARWRYGFLVVITGLVVILIGFVVISLRSEDTNAAFAASSGCRVRSSAPTSACRSVSPVRTGSNPSCAARTRSPSGSPRKSTRTTPTR
ncbi:hypothetical protein ACFQX6_62410 [Streptosporangium lutulentum]